MQDVTFFVNSRVAQQILLLLHSSDEPSSILTSGAICMECAHSSDDYVHFPEESFYLPLLTDALTDLLQIVPRVGGCRENWGIDGQTTEKQVTGK